MKNIVFTQNGPKVYLYVRFYSFLFAPALFFHVINCVSFFWQGENAIFNVDLSVNTDQFCKVTILDKINRTFRARCSPVLVFERPRIGGWVWGCYCSFKIAV